MLEHFRKMMIGANWKTYINTEQKVLEFINNFKKKLNLSDSNLLDIYMLPDFLSFKKVIEKMKNMPILVGTQDIFWEDGGSYTGEVSPKMLASMGGQCVFIGHSERKRYFGETDETINNKVLACYRNKLIPILLVGETEQEKNDGLTEKVVKRQIRAALKGIPKKFMENVVVVYEPVWAIGKRVAASIDIIQKSHIMVRDSIEKLYDKNTATKTRIIYGGSVNYDNSKDIIKIPDVDGLAMTRASLDSANFVKIIRLVEEEARKRADRKKN